MRRGGGDHWGQDASFKHIPPGWQDRSMCNGTLLPSLRTHMLKKRDNCPLTFIYIVWHVCVYTQEEEEEEKQQQQIRG